MGLGGRKAGNHIKGSNMIDHTDVSSSTLRLLVFQALKEYPTQALFPLLTDPDDIVRTGVARELQIRGSEDVFAHASELLKGDRFETREIAAFVLGQLGTPNFPYRDQSIPLLRPLLHDKYYEVRGAAAAALGHLKANEALNDLLELASDSEAYVRENVAFALAFTGADQRSIATLRKLSNDDNSDVRGWAEFALEEHGEHV